MHSLPHSSVSPIGSPSNQDFAYSPISPYSSYLPTTPHNSFTNPALLPSSPATFLTSLTTLTNLVPRPDSSSFDSSSTISYNLFRYCFPCFLHPAFHLIASPWGDKPAWRVVSNAGGSSSAPTTNPSPPLAHTHHGGNGTASELNDPWMDDFFLSMGGLELESPSPGPLSSTQPQQSSQARPHRYSPLPMPMPDSTPSPYVSSRRGSIPAPQSPIYPTGFISSSAPPIAPRMTTTSGTFPLPAPIGALPSTQQPFPVRSPPTSPPRKRTGPSSPNTGRRNKSKQHSVSYHGNESTFHSIPPINARSPPYAHSNGNRFQAMSPQRSRGKSGRSRRMSHDNGTETAHSFGVGANGGGGGGGNNSRKNTRGRDDQDLSRFDIDIDRVNAGLDKRTTLMIKNIPNKYDQSMLLETLDRSFSRTYDFFYLPIDFKVVPSLPAAPRRVAYVTEQMQCGLCVHQLHQSPLDSQGDGRIQPLHVGTIQLREGVQSELCPHSRQACLHRALPQQLFDARGHLLSSTHLLFVWREHWPSRTFPCRQRSSHWSAYSIGGVSGSVRGERRLIERGGGG